LQSISEQFSLLEKEVVEAISDKVSVQEFDRLRQEVSQKLDLADAQVIIDDQKNQITQNLN